MSGIYIHIPFCKQACHYCNFHFSTSLHYKQPLVKAIAEEIVIRRDYLENDPVSTIYFGGGTPSLCSHDELNLIMQQIRSQFSIFPDPEITLEANPDDITEEKLMEWKSAGINRLSIGIQSFFEEDLRWMNRAHSAEQAHRQLQLSLKHFQNITIDLIYGTPELTDEKWEKNVQTAIDMGVPHLSCYALTVEPKTALDKLIKQHRYADVNPDTQSNQFLQLMEWMDKAGYEHYEISNFARPGWRSRHNSSYWQGSAYLGLGPSAHSYNGKTRQWNVSNNQQYIRSITEGNIPFEAEELTAEQMANEYIMTSLRTVEGLQLDKLGKAFEETVLRNSGKFIETDLMTLDNNILRLTREGKLLADGIAADLFV